jgi:hypothetical protein
MKQTAIENRAQAQMRPGVITHEGMLGADERHLIDILETDAAAVQRLGLTHQAIAARMRELRRAGMAGLGNAVRVAPHFEVTVDGVRGRMPCPYEDGTTSKTNTVVANQHLGRTLVFTDLHIHMIERHGFYMGLGSVYRLNPDDLAEVLEVPALPAPGIPQS